MFFYFRDKRHILRRGLEVVGGRNFSRKVAGGRSHRALSVCLEARCVARALGRRWAMKGNLLMVVLGACALVAGCSHPEQSKGSIAEYARSLKGVIAAAPKSVIDLDAIEPETAYPDLVIPSDTLSKEGGLFLASPQNVVVLGDSLYISERMNHGIVVANRQGKLIRLIGRQGQGLVNLLSLGRSRQMTA